MTIRGTLAGLIVATSAFLGFILGFHEGSRTSLWSDFVLKGVIAGQRLTALEKGNQEFVRATLKSEIALGVQAHAELIQLRGYDHLSAVTGVELHGLKEEYLRRLEQYQSLTHHSNATH